MWSTTRTPLVRIAVATIMLAGLLSPGSSATTHASHTPNPSAVTIAGSFQSELGCPGDWQPDCAATQLAYDAFDDVWQASYPLPGGSYEYKAALNNSWNENYGLHASQNGPNISLALPAAATVKFYYDHKSHWVTDNRSSIIAVAPGSFQSELGCPGDWDPSCLRSWLQDPDGDGVYTFETAALSAGSYEAKVAINESWDENYGAGGVPNGNNIPFTVPANNARMVFRYDATTHILTISSPPVNAPPVVNAGADATLTAGQAFSLSAGFTDAAADGPWTYTVDWGDGSADETGSATVPGLAVIAASHPYPVPQTYTIQVCVTDRPGLEGCDSLRLAVTLSQVTIDVKPGESPNSINPKSKGKTAVGVLSSATFDATSLDRATVRFADAPALAKGDGIDDLNGDGRPDRVFHFDTQALQLDADATQACLTGQTTAGVSVQGCDAVQLDGQKPPKAPKTKKRSAGAE